ncbi:MAG: hypothetical protein ACFFC6_07080 [Promethearchaeota archaeon]
MHLIYVHLTILAENCNSIYSLIPFLVSIFAIPFLPITGKLIEDYGMVTGVFVPLSVRLLGSLFIFISYFSEKSSLEPTQDVSFVVG